MRLLMHNMLDAYLRDDVILRLLDEHSHEGDEAFTTQRWLRDSGPKRCIYRELYGDLLDGSRRGARVLDVGGGYTGLSRLLARPTDYTLLDIMSHDSLEGVRAVEREEGCSFLIDRDWLQFAEVADEYDLIIANDLFPNVDQRLGLFLERYLPRCVELRLSLTYYNTPRWYPVKRLDGEEVFHMVAWDGETTRRVLERFAAHMDRPRLSTLLKNPPSLYSNGRQVCLAHLRGVPAVNPERSQGVTVAPETNQDHLLR